jgi:hypothetical protein
MNQQIAIKYRKLDAGGNPVDKYDSNANITPYQDHTPFELIKRYFLGNFTEPPAIFIASIDPPVQGLPAPCVLGLKSSYVVNSNSPTGRYPFISLVSNPSNAPPSGPMPLSSSGGSGGSGGSGKRTFQRGSRLSYDGQAAAIQAVVNKEPLGVEVKAAMRRAFEATKQQREEIKKAKLEAKQKALGPLFKSLRHVVANGDWTIKRNPALYSEASARAYIDEYHPDD